MAHGAGCMCLGGKVDMMRSSGQQEKFLCETENSQPFGCL
jgi:hypothetical protein